MLFPELIFCFKNIDSDDFQKGSLQEFKFTSSIINELIKTITDRLHKAF